MNQISYQTMMEPEVEGLIDTAGSKFSLCTLSSNRARQIKAYFGQLGGGIGKMVPPQVTSSSTKPLTIAFEEIEAGKIVPIVPEPKPEDEADTKDSAKAKTKTKTKDKDAAKDEDAAADKGDVKDDAKVDVKADAKSESK